MTTASIATQPALSPAIRWDDFQEMNLAAGDFSIYELVNGILVKRVAPSIQASVLPEGFSIEFASLFD